jgi:DnaJ-class molecular chaperone
MKNSWYHTKKQERTEYYKKYVYGWKQRPCVACNGSGIYDHNGSPKCGACNGTGKVRYKSIINNKGE